MTQSFAVDDLNRLTTAANSGTLTLAGTVNVPGSTVTVNGSAATVYADGSFVRTGQPLTGTYTAVATDPNGRSATNVITGSTAASVTFTYDANGNLTGWCVGESKRILSPQRTETP